MRLIDADVLYERLKADEELARDRVIDTPNSFPNGAVNPSAIRYMAQLNERTRFKEIVFDAPTIEKTEWIPVTERLPDDLQEVNITYINTNPEPYYDFVKGYPFTGSAVYYKGSWYWYSSTCVDILAEYGRNEMDKIDDAIEVTAWMPLPLPFREGGES